MCVLQRVVGGWVGGDVLARQMESKSKKKKRETRECESLTLSLFLLNLLNMTSPACGQT